MKRILILSGEGTNGIFEEYTGSGTDRAIKSRLTKERQNGDRWAKAFILVDGYTYQDFESGELKTIPEEVIR